MKRFIAFLFAFVLSVMPFTVCGENTEYKNPAVTDKGGFLTDCQYKEISDLLNEIRQKYNFDISVYTEDIMSYQDAQSAADNIFDYMGYGYGEKADGMILYISASPRSYHFSTHGKGEEWFNDNGLKYLEKQILPSLKSDDYYSALSDYAKFSDSLLDMGTKGTPFNKRQYSNGYFYGVIISAVLLPLLIALLLTLKKLSKMNTAKDNDYAQNYIKKDGMHLGFSRDIFLYSTVTKIPKPKENSGGHISSSGEHHGGRGGSY